MSDRPTALVTGAGGGVGQALSCLLAAAGYDLMLTSRTKEKLDATAEQVRGEVGDAVEVESRAADLTDPRGARGGVGGAVERFDRLDVLGCVAGHAPLGPIQKIEADEWRKTIDANVSYVMHMTAEAWGTFRKQKSGMVAAVSSIAAFDPFPGFAMYAPAKAALNLFITCVANEGAKMNVKSVAVAPGAIETPMLRQNFNEKTIPTEKCLDPYEVAGMLKDCITGERAFQSGETIQQPSP